MKKFTLLFFGLLTFFTGFSQDLITDGGFEDDPLNAAWTKTGAALATVTDDPLFGSRRANFGNEAIEVRQNITAVSAVVYRVSFYWRFSNAASTTDAFASIRLQSDDSVIKQITLPKSTGDWTFSSFTFSVTGAGADLDLYVQFHKFARNSVSPTSVNNAMRFDNVSIVPVVIAPNGDDLITNGTLETEDTSGFTIGAGVTVTGFGSIFQGNASLNMGDNFRSFTQDFTATAGVLYQLSFYFRYNNAAVSGTTVVRIQNSSGANLLSLTLPVTTHDWTYFTTTFVAPEAGLQLDVFKNARSVAPNNAARFDNISVKPLYEWTGSTDTDWATAGNWDVNSVPPTGASVLVSDVANAPTISASTGVNVYDLDINEPDNGLTINGGGSLDVDGTVSGNITYNRTLVAGKWHLLGSPVVGQVYNDTWIADNNIASGAGSNRGIGTYQNGAADPTTGQWVYMQSGGSDTFNSSTGYALRSDVGGPVSFTGTYPTGAKPATVTNANANKFNLISNPFPTYLAVSEFFTNNGVAKFTESTIWLWDQSSGASGAYVPKTSGSDGAFEIAPGQGFFISSGDGTQIEFFQFNGGNATDTFLKSENSRTEVSLSMKEGNNTKNTNLHYIDAATNAFDNGYDASLFTGVSSDFSLYTALVSDSNKKLGRQVLSINDMETTIVPVGVIATAGKEITFTATTANFTDGLKVYLEDRLNNTFTQIDAGNSFKFTTSQDLNGTGRFYLHTTTQSVLSADSAILENVSVYANTSTLKIAGLPQGEATVSLFNILGKQVLNSSFNAKGNKEITLPKLAKGVYVVRLTTASGKLNKKIILE